MNISQIDLNLLLVLHVVLEERSATRAAQRLRVTQSAVSNALGRLRDLFADPLVVRHARGLSPTPRARALQGQLADLVRGMQNLFGIEATFEPSTTRREFVVACADYYGMVILPQVVELLKARAPSATLRVVPLERLSQGGGLAEDIDVHLGMPPSIPAGCSSRDLFSDRFVCLVPRTRRVQYFARERTRPLRPSVMTLKEYTRGTHVRVRVLDVQRDPIDQALAQRGLARNIAVTVPHFSMAPLLVVQNGYIATLSRRLAEVYAEMLPLALREPPLQLGMSPAQMVWHQRTERDPGALFFRQLIQEAAG